MKNLENVQVIELQQEECCDTEFQNEQMEGQNVKYWDDDANHTLNQMLHGIQIFLEPYIVHGVSFCLETEVEAGVHVHARYGNLRDPGQNIAACYQVVIHLRAKMTKRLHFLFQ